MRNYILELLEDKERTSQIFEENKARQILPGKTKIIQKRKCNYSNE
jgi:hypothetical protein